MPATAALLVAMAPLLLAACNDEHDYEYSVDVHSSGWTPTDTLFYPIHANQHPTSFSPIQIHYPYCLGLVVRYDKSFPAPILPLRIQLDKEYRVLLDLGDAGSLPDGSTWGSLCTKEFDITRMVLSFPDSGDYVLKVWPEERVETVSSLTVILE